MHNCGNLLLLLWHYYYYYYSIALPLSGWTPLCLSHLRSGMLYLIPGHFTTQALPSPFIGTWPLVLPVPGALSPGVFYPVPNPSGLWKSILCHCRASTMMNWTSTGPCIPLPLFLAASFHALPSIALPPWALPLLFWTPPRPLPSHVRSSMSQEGLD